MSEMTKGLLAGILAFCCWGLFPLYWKLFPELSGENIFINRLFSTVVTLFLLIPFLGRWEYFKEILHHKKKRVWLTLSAFLIASNWLIYMIAVTEGQILQASMGYFLSPLINVLIGRMVLKETLRPLQLPAVLLAIAGVLWMGIASDMSSFPWVAVSLALTFACYGVIRKLNHVGPIEGLAFESSVVFLPFFFWWYSSGGSVAHDVAVLSTAKLVILSLSGIVTCLPLILFAYATHRLPLQTLGFIQYLSPTLKFLCGWVIFHEALSPVRLQGFIFIWVGLIWYTFEQMFYVKKKRSAQKISAPNKTLV